MSAPIYRFMRIDKNGANNIVSYTKQDFPKCFPGMVERDVHIIDKNLQFKNSAIIARDNFIMVKLYYIRCIIDRTHVYISQTVEENLPLIKLSEFENGLIRIIKNKNYDSFELRVLEYIFSSIKDYFDDIIDNILNPQVSRIYGLIENDQISSLVTHKDYIKINKYLISIKQKVDDIYGLFNGITLWKYNEFDEFYIGREHNYGDEKRNDPLVDLMEIYKGHFEENSDNANSLEATMNSSVTIANMHIAYTRNEIAKFDISVNIMMLSMMVASLVTGSFGMNVNNYLEDDKYAFIIICGILFIVTIILYFVGKSIFISRIKF